MESAILKSVWKVIKMENNYQLSRIHNYINGLMTKEDMYALEREALEDPFLQDAIDGYKLQNGVDAKQLSLLQQRLLSRVKEQTHGRNNRFYSWQRLAIGMTAAVMFVTVCTLLLLRYLPQNKTVDMKEVMVTEVVYDYTVDANNTNNDVFPDGGWDKLYTVLNTQYTNSQNYNGVLDIQFEVDASRRPFNIKINGNSFQRDEELEDLLRNKIKWTGQKASFQLDINKIGF